MNSILHRSSAAAACYVVQLYMGLLAQEQMTCAPWHDGRQFSAGQTAALVACAVGLLHTSAAWQQPANICAVSFCWHRLQCASAAASTESNLFCILLSCEFDKYGPPEIFAHDVASQAHSIDRGFLSEECGEIIQIGIVRQRCHIQATLICLPCCLIKRGWCLQALEISSKCIRCVNFHNLSSKLTVALLTLLPSALTISCWLPLLRISATCTTHQMLHHIQI